METLPFLGHREIFQALETQRRADRLPHALLFLGPEGVGKQKVARHLAERLLCHDAKPPCRTCASCRLFISGRHPDLWVLEPENGRVKIDAVRELKKSLTFAPLAGTQRVILLPETHALNQAAANALLKTLEEPPEATYFFLVTHAPGWVPKTIVSRCQKVRFPPLSETELKAVLKSQGLEPDASTLNWAQGSAQAAIRLAAAAEKFPAVESLWPGPGGLSVDAAYTLGQSSAEDEQRYVFLDALLADTHRILTQGRAPEARRFELLAFAERIFEFRRELRQNANPKLHLPRLLMFFQEPLGSRL
ncbi:MAG TPA: DNA polymerase III subunit delta' [Deltaproteobacteria bacterium]|nr:DNA polymerase III subunit delta' [Deltaproteobacteria bacterium]